MTGRDTFCATVLASITLAACGTTGHIGVDGAVAITPDADTSGVRIIRGAPDQTHWVDLDVVATGFSNSEGAPVTIQVGMPERPPERLGFGQTRVLNGAFQLTFPAVLENDLYKRKVVWIDVDRDGKCGGYDIVMSDYGFGIAGMPYVWSAIPPTFHSLDCTAVETSWPME
jgi:hypothetical protein